MPNHDDLTELDGGGYRMPTPGEAAVALLVSAAAIAALIPIIHIAFRAVRSGRLAKLA